MKISIDLYNIAKKFGDFKAIEMVADAGFDAIDYGYFWDRECEEVLGDGYIEYAEKLREHLDNVGIACNQVHAPFSIQYGCGHNETDPLYLNMVRSMESAAILGAKTTVIHSITVPQGVDLKQYNLEYYRSFIPYCKKFGIRMAVENLFIRDEKGKVAAGKLNTPEELNEMVERLDSPWVVACVDIGHSSLTGLESVGFIKGVKPQYLKALHVQDTDYVNDCHVLPYTGALDWKAIMTTLKEVGYNGELTFEVLRWLEKFPDELVPEVLRFSAKVGKQLVSIYENA